MSLDSMKGNGLTQKARSRYPTKTITDGDYADDQYTGSNCISAT